MCIFKEATENNLVVNAETDRSLQSDMIQIMNKFLQFLQLNHDFYYYGDQYEIFINFSNAFNLVQLTDLVLKHENSRLDDLMLKSAK